MLAKEKAAQALEKVFSGMGLEKPKRLTIEEPKNPSHGDLSTNAALLLAKECGRNPREIAAEIAAALPGQAPEIERVEVAGPGFCNIFFRKDFWQALVEEVERKGDAFGNNDSQRGKRALVEYVSANPTGPLHIGHGRGAALGDSVTRILRACGAEVSTEYYLNDAGRQMATLGHSIWLRMQELADRRKAEEFPDDCYKGAYIIDLAKELMNLEPGIENLPEKQGIERCRLFGIKNILDGIKKDLNDFECEHQNYFSELSLVNDGSVQAIFEELAQTGNSYEADGAIWFRSTSGGDDRDRVLKKSDGSLTYFATDIAYHKNKFDRGYDHLIDVWGADHHGYIARLRGAIKSIGKNPEAFTVLLVQLVNLLANGEKISMSTRAGKFETLADVIKAVGKDAARFMFLSRSSDSPLDFDLELATRRTMDNPVYYVQYAHARIAALLRRGEMSGLVPGKESPAEATALLSEDEELALLRKMAAFEDTVISAGRNLAPQYIVTYLQELATRIHSYYGKYTVIGDDKSLSLARLGLLRAAAQILRNGLYLLGVNAPESM